MNEFFPAFLVLANVDNHHVSRWVFGFDEALNSFFEHVLFKLGSSKFAVNSWLICFVSKFLSTFDVVLFVEENLNCFNVLLELFVNCKSFFVELVFIIGADFGNFLTFVVIKSIDVVHNAFLLNLDSSQNHEVL